MRTCQILCTIACVFLLAACGNEAQDLVARLKTRDTEELRQVTSKLVRLPNGIAVPALRQGLQSDKWRTRYMSAQLLGRFGAPEAVPDLLAALADSIGGVRAQAAGALGQLAAREAVPPLIVMLDDDSEIVQTAAAAALGHLGSAAALPALLPLAHSRGLTLRTAVVQALGPCAADSLDQGYDEFRHQAMQASRTALHDIFARVRIAGIVSLRGAAYRGCLADLVRLVDDRSAEVQHVAVQALGEITSTMHPAWAGHPAPDMSVIVNALQRASQADNEAVRLRAAESLQKLAAAENGH